MDDVVSFKVPKVTLQPPPKKLKTSRGGRTRNSENSKKLSAKKASEIHSQNCEKRRNEQFMDTDDHIFQVNYCHNVSLKCLFQHQKLKCLKHLSVSDLKKRYHSLKRKVKNKPYSKDELVIYFQMVCDQIEIQLKRCITSNSSKLKISVDLICKKIGSTHNISNKKLKNLFLHWIESQLCILVLYRNNRFSALEFGIPDERKCNRAGARRLEILDLVEEQNAILNFVCKESFWHHRSINAPKIRKFCLQQLDPG